MTSLLAAESLRVLGIGSRGGPRGEGYGPEKADQLVGQMTPQALRPHGLSSAMYLHVLT